MTADQPKKASDDDPVEAQLRFEAALYGDWYSRSVLAAYVQEKSSTKPNPETANVFRPDRDPCED